MKKINILMIDDDEGDTFMAREALSEEDVDSLHVVHDGLEAIEFLEKKGVYANAPNPDLILLDINMPRMSGHEVLMWLRAHEKYRLTPVIMLTTSNSERDIMESYENNANCYITKPVDMEQFNSMIKAIDMFWSGFAQFPPRMA